MNGTRGGGVGAMCGVLVVVFTIVSLILSFVLVTTDAGDQLVNMLKQLQSKTPALFEPEEARRYVKKWIKFKELIFILGASLREIEESWGGGQGRLSGEFPAEQVKQLIRALFQNTERRAAVLAKIK